MPGRHPAEVLRTLLDASPLGIIAVDAEGLVRLWNHGAQKVLGWTEDEILGRNPPVEMRLLREGETELTRAQGKDGSVVALEIRVAPWRDEQANVDGKLAILNDITPRLRMEGEIAKLIALEKEAQRIARSESRFRELLEAAPDAIIEIDSEGHIVLL